MQKLFFAVLIVITVLVAVRLYRQHHAPERPTDLSSLSNIATQQQLPALNTDENDGEFEEEHPEITANDEETLIEED